VTFAALASVSAWLSYPSIFISGGACMWLLSARTTEVRGPRWGHVLTTGAPIVLSFLAMYLLAGSAQRAAAPASYWSAGFPPLSEPWRVPGWLLDVHTGMMMAYPNGGHSGGSSVSFVLAVIGGIVLWRTRRRVLLLLLSPVPLMLVAAALHAYPYGASARVTQHFAPAACLLIGTGLLCVLRKVVGARRAVRAIPIAVLPFLVVAIAGIARDVARPYHSKADAIVRETIAGLSLASMPGDRWVLYAGRDDSGPAPRYSRFVGMGGRIHFQILSQAPGPVLWGPDPSRVPAAAGRTWLIAYGNRVFEPERSDWETYVQEWSVALGEVAERERYELPDAEWIEVVRLGGT
jgi:hypothetical protein